MREIRINKNDQKGAVLLVVVVLFLVILPLLMAIFMTHNAAGTTQGITSSMRSTASDVAKQQLAVFRKQIDAALMNGALEYQATPPAWFVKSNNMAQVNVRSTTYWNTCAQNNLCQQSTVAQVNQGGGSTNFTVSQLVVPTGITDPLICGQNGFVAIFYNVFIHVQAQNSIANGGNTLQSTYRTCQRAS